MVSEQTVLQPGYVAKCHRCKQPLYKADKPKFNRLFALSLTAVIVSIPAFTLSLVSVHLLGITEQTNLLQGALLLINFAPVVAFVVLFCAVVAPTLLSSCILFSSSCVLLNKRPTLLNPILKLTSVLLHWSMLEVYLISFIVAVFKLNSYADLYYDSGLFFLVILMVVNMAMINEYNNADFWEYLGHDSSKSDN